jgi:hypothetical protein
LAPQECPLISRKETDVLEYGVNIHNQYHNLGYRKWRNMAYLLTNYHVTSHEIKYECYSVFIGKEVRK